MAYHARSLTQMERSITDRVDLAVKLAQIREIKAAKHAERSIAKQVLGRQAADKVRPQPMPAIRGM